MDDDIIDITDYSERPANEKRSPRPKQTTMTHTATQGHCPTPQNSPTYLPRMQWQQPLPSLIEPRSGGSSQTREKYPVDGQHV